MFEMVCGGPFTPPISSLDRTLAGTQDLLCAVVCGQDGIKYPYEFLGAGVHSLGCSASGCVGVVLAA